MKNIIVGLIASASFVSLAAISNVAIANVTTENSPYAGLESREIKALSEREVSGYLEGKGLGYAKAAELNNFPGPSHVLELSKGLALTDEQIKQTQIIFNKMKAQAAILGEQFVSKERELDQLFLKSTINTKVLKVLTADIGDIQAKIRYVHLSAHLEQKELLTKHQIHLYNKLRGYTDSPSGGHNHSH